MTINFRRNALQLSVAALFSSAFMANAADIPQVKVTVTVWYMDIDTTAKYKSGVTTVKDSVRLDPWVFMFSAGYRF